MRRVCLLLLAACLIALPATAQVRNGQAVGIARTLFQPCDPGEFLVKSATEPYGVSCADAGDFSGDTLVDSDTIDVTEDPAGTFTFTIPTTATPEVAGLGIGTAGVSGQVVGDGTAQLNGFTSLSTDDLYPQTFDLNIFSGGSGARTIIHTANGNFNISDATGDGHPVLYGEDVSWVDLGLPLNPIRAAYIDTLTLTNALYDQGLDKGDAVEFDSVSNPDGDVELITGNGLTDGVIITSGGGTNNRIKTLNGRLILAPDDDVVEIDGEIYSPEVDTVLVTNTDFGGAALEINTNNDGGAIIVNATSGDLTLSTTTTGKGIFTFADGADFGSTTVTGTEVSTPSAPAANGWTLFSKDSGGGKTQLCALFNSGAAQCFATQP